MRAPCGQGIGRAAGAPTWSRPSPGDGEVLVRVRACGIGLTVLNCCVGQLGDDRRSCAHPGHELVGVVTQLAPGCPRCSASGVRVLLPVVSARARSAWRLRRPLCERFRGNFGVGDQRRLLRYAVRPARTPSRAAGIDPWRRRPARDAIARASARVAARRPRACARGCAVLAAAARLHPHCRRSPIYGADVSGLDVVPTSSPTCKASLALPRRTRRISRPSSCRRRVAGRADVVVRPVRATARRSRCAIDHLPRNGTLVAWTSSLVSKFAVSSRELVQRQLTVTGSRLQLPYEVGLAARFFHSGRVAAVVSAVVGPDEVAATLDAVRAGTILGRAPLPGNPWIGGSRD